MLKYHLERGPRHLHLRHVLLSTSDLRISKLIINSLHCYDCDLVDIQSHAIFSWHMLLNWGLCRRQGLPSFDLAGPPLSPKKSTVITASITSSKNSLRLPNKSLRDYLTIVEARYEVKESPELIFIDRKASQHCQAARLARKLEAK